MASQSLHAVCAVTLTTALAASQGFAQDVGGESFGDSASSVVRVAATKKGHSGVGVILSPEGHVLLRSNPFLDDKALTFSLADGRTAKGTLLGWSEEWNISVAKITDPGPWPFVTLNERGGRISVGDTCSVIGYELGEVSWAKNPVRRDIEVTKTASNLWFGSRAISMDGGYAEFGPVFDAGGRVVGFIGARGRTWAYLHADQLRSLLDAILIGKSRSLDEVRLKTPTVHDEKSRPYEIKARAPVDPRKAKQAAVDSTVRISPGNGGNGCSGVIISVDGFIVSCGHGYEVPGTEVIVNLADGRNATGEFCGVNPITDIALLKILDKGPWPFSPVCDSSPLAPESPSWFIGYPATGKGRRPLVRDTKIVSPSNAEFHVLYTSKAAPMFGGDSGGGVFDQQGRLLGILQGYNSDGKTPGRHTRIETLRVQWDILTRTSDKH